MNIMAMDKEFENDLLEKWAVEMQKPLPYFMEPFLDETVVNIVKLACDTFKQNEQVFFSSVDIIEQYIYLKELRKEKIADPFLAVTAIIFIVSKSFGGGADLKIPIIEKFLLKITCELYNSSAIMQAEKDILKILQYKIPFTTILDDFDVFYEKFIRKYCLREVIRPLCVQLLVLLYCTKKTWLEKLRNLYKREARALKHLLCLKLYLPAGVLISAFKLTDYNNYLDIAAVLDDLKTFTDIHPDHIYALSDIIINLRYI